MFPSSRKAWNGSRNAALLPHEERRGGCAPQLDAEQRSHRRRDLPHVDLPEIAVPGDAAPGYEKGGVHVRVMRRETVAAMSGEVGYRVSA